jgi:hypothetical protein
MQLSPDVSRVLAGLIKQVARVRQDRKIWALTLDALASHYGAAGTVLLYRKREGDLYKVRSVGKQVRWDEQPLLDFFHNRKPELDATVVMAPVRLGNRVIGVLALARTDPFLRGAGREATEVLKVIGLWMGWRRDLALREAECATGRAILGRVAPKDVAYRILHQLRRFIDYNHGASVLGFAGEGSARVLARQIAWMEGRSDMVGKAVEIRWSSIPKGPGGSILREGVSPLWNELERVKEAEAPPKKSIMIVRLADDDGDVGLVDVSSTIPVFFLDNDLEVLSRFLPYLTWCVRRMADIPKETGG